MNRLASETSPYLLQHAGNPVDWYAWGPEAFDAAKAQDKPIFLSIGYSACHWCHVMEHESFEDAAIAGLMNERFVNIKVDREERPDLDQIYMQAVQLMTGRGGWPMSVFLTHELKPFYGGTYWPPHPKFGMPGFDQVLEGVSNAWRERREAVLEQARQLTSNLDGVDEPSAKPTSIAPSATPRSGEPLIKAASQLERTFDARNGGFGGAPKFPHALDLRLLLRVWRHTPRDELLAIVTTTLDKMADGGIYDHLGGGFHRYSVDERWLVPHFEKMLYDNAMLLPAYLEAYQVTGNDRYARVVRETADYVLRDMTDSGGGFYSTEDADSEGVEGKFYVWTPKEVEDVLGADAAETFCHVYDVTDTGNFEEANILNVSKTLAQSAALLFREPADLEAELIESRQKLLAAREKRVRPGRDDKVLVSWNALMIDALAAAGAVLNEPKYVNAATRAADFLWANLRTKDGRLLHTWRAGQAKVTAYLDDYATLASALVTLYEASADERWIDAAIRLANDMLAHFADSTEGGFFFTADDHETLIARPKDMLDSSVPSGNAMAATALVRLGKLCGRADYFEAANRTLTAASKLMERAPAAAGQMLLALDLWVGPTHELVLVAPVDDRNPASLLHEVQRPFWPEKLVARRPAAGSSRALDAIFADRTARDGQVTLYVCENFACQAPLVGRDAIVAEVARLARAGKLV
ncbi:MAG TPA: thioredoxin domain-containing protein [Pirellulales bacterium]|nr:thioredoxin domain-containing protein [Pirellulales bacterium]